MLGGGCDGEVKFGKPLVINLQHKSTGDELTTITQRICHRGVNLNKLSLHDVRTKIILALLFSNTQLHSD